MKSNLILIISIIVAIAVIGVAFFLLKPVEQVSLPLKIEEYADFNCVHCQNFYPVSKQLKEEFGDKIDFEFINHPILGSSSEQAAFASEAAKEQGKFKEYIDKLFSNNNARSDEDYVRFATELELDIKKFNADRESTSLQQRVLEQFEKNRTEKAVNATPTVFINGRKQVSLSYDALKAVIEDKIALAESQENK